jgi:hypothetical protein
MKRMTGSFRNAATPHFLPRAAVLGLTGACVLWATTGVSSAQKPAAPAAGAEKLVPIAFQLPKPMFEGTPQNLSVPNLEKPLGRARDPFLAPAGVSNLAKGKKVSSSDMEPVIGELELLNDGDKKGADGSFVELGPGVQHVTIDLGAVNEVYAILSGTSTRPPGFTSTSSSRWRTTPRSRRTSERCSTTTTTTLRGWERART